MDGLRAVRPIRVRLAVNPFIVPLSTKATKMFVEFILQDAEENDELTFCRDNFEAQS